MDGLQAPIPGEEEGDEIPPDQPEKGTTAGETDPPAAEAAPATPTGSAAPAAATIPVSSDALNQLMLAFACMTTQNAAQTSIVPQPRPFVPDFRKDLNLATWPSYSGDFKSFRKFKKEVLFTLTMLPAESHSKVVPYLIKSADKEFKARWMRANHDMSLFDGPGSLEKLYAEIKRARVEPPLRRPRSPCLDIPKESRGPLPQDDSVGRATPDMDLMSRLIPTLELTRHLLIHGQRRTGL